MFFQWEQFIQILYTPTDPYPSEHRLIILCYEEERPVSYERDGP